MLAELDERQNCLQGYCIPCESYSQFPLDKPLWDDTQDIPAITDEKQSLIDNQAKVIEIQRTALERIDSYCIGRLPSENTFSGINVLVLIKQEAERALAQGAVKE
jgi:hypothetical protein